MSTYVYIAFHCIRDSARFGDGRHVAVAICGNMWQYVAICGNMWQWAAPAQLTAKWSEKLSPVQAEAEDA